MEERLEGERGRDGDKSMSKIEEERTRRKKRFKFPYLITFCKRTLD